MHRFDEKYGYYPGTRRFHYDQVPLEFSQYGKRSYNPKGAGSCWIAGSKVDLSKRFATLNLFFCAEAPQTVRPGIIFRLKPTPGDVTLPVDSRIKKEMKLYDDRVFVQYDAKAYASEDVCLSVLDHFEDEMPLALLGPVMLGLDNWECQNSDTFHQKADKMGISLVYTPENCTDLVAVTDAGPGNEIKRRMVALYKKDLESSPERLNMWKNGKVSASERRILYTKWLGESWEDFTQNHQDQITKAFKRCGMFNAIDGSENHLIKIPRYHGQYEISKPPDFDQKFHR